MPHLPLYTGAPGSVVINISARIVGHCLVFKWNTATFA